MPPAWPICLQVFADEQQAPAIGFLSRAVAWFNGQGVVCCQVSRKRSRLPITQLCQGM
jgi:hypothetical protein